jgi:hypothetical protein
METKSFTVHELPCSIWYNEEYLMEFSATPTGATAWQGPGGTHGGSKGNLKTSSTYEQSTKVKVPFPIKEDEEDLGIID